MGEALSLCRSSISLVLMTLILVLDITVDKPEVNEDVCRLLNKAASKQEALLETLMKLKIQIRKV